LKPTLHPGKLRNEIHFKLNGEAVPCSTHRPVQQVSLSCHLKGVALPHVDPTDPETVLIGQNRRVCFEPPKLNRKRLRRFARFVRRWLRRHSGLEPLSPSLDTTFEAWLDSKDTYPDWRKIQLREIWYKFDTIMEKRHFIVGGFVKDETYPEYKNARGINARSDMFKCFSGPFFSLIEKELFKKIPWFIKYVPVPDRARLIYETLYDESSLFYGTDHTSFEGHFQPDLMKVCEFELYRYMIQYLDGGKQFMEICESVLAGVNKVFFKYFFYEIEATRMTGEMCTSLGNGFTNLMLILFVASESGFPDIFSHFGFVEGDDSIFRGPKDKPLQTHIFKELGFTIKLEKFEEINTASFCGNVFAPGDFYTVTNPLETMAGFGWTTARYARSKDSKLKCLLRSKSLSLLYEYRGCPILKHLALYGLRMTERYRAKSVPLNQYKAEKLKMQLQDMKENGLPIVEIPMDTRILVERLYGISVDVQLKYESYLDSLTELQPLDIYLLDQNVHPEQIDYFNRYVQDVKMKGDIDHPNIPHESMVIWNEEYIKQVDLVRSTIL